MSELCVGNSSVVKIYIIRPKPGPVAKNATPRPSGWESNPRPLDYQTSALPLSYRSRKNIAETFLGAVYMSLANRGQPG